MAAKRTRSPRRRNTLPAARLSKWTGTHLTVISAPRLSGTAEGLRSVVRTPVPQLPYGAGVIECLERHLGGVVIRVIGWAFGARGAGGVTRVRGAQRRRRRWLRAQARSLDIDRRVRRSSCTRSESMDPRRLVRVLATPRRR